MTRRIWGKLAGAPWTAIAMSIAMLPVAPARGDAAPAATDGSGDTATAVAAPIEVPAWLYPLNPAPGATTAADDATPLHVPDSRAAFTRAQVTDRFAPPDWHPDDHPPMPEIVAHGSRPRVMACGYCHLPDGQGRPENAAVAGLPAAYIAQQVRAFASHARVSAWQGPYRPADLMRTLAENVTDADLMEAAGYFSGLRLSRRVEVVEAARVPVTHAEGWLYVPTEAAGEEPLGERIIEVALDQTRHELRDSATRYRAYVPPGSRARGARIVTAGADGLTQPCTGCHGIDLRGAGLIPPIAGRSPSYIVRQLLAFRTGARAAAAGQPMQGVVARLQVEDMIAIAAYVASREP